MVIRNKQISSISLISLATFISLLEYNTYTPTPESNLSQNVPHETTQETKDEEETKTETETQNHEDNKDTTDQTIEPPFYKTNEYTTKFKNGDTLANILDELGFDKKEIHQASKSLSKVFNLRSIKTGQEITIKATKDQNGDLTLDSIEIQPNIKNKIIVKKSENGYTAKLQEIQVKSIIKNISGIISTQQPKESLIQLGINKKLSKEVIQALNHTVNIKQNQGDIDFEFVYKEFYDDQGSTIGTPELLYASTCINGTIYKVYKFQHNGTHEYIDQKGKILTLPNKKQQLLSKPLNTMKISSKFGIRRHPITGRVKGHTGIDLSAKIGTPVYAAANGYVQRASRYSGYGKYILIKHNTSVNTAYAHLSKIQVKPGQYVQKGQIIGYTGNSGISTGPHLHYEVIQNGRYINPLTHIKQEPQTLQGEKLRKFKQFQKTINLQIVGLPTNKNIS